MTPMLSERYGMGCLSNLRFCLLLFTQFAKKLRQAFRRRVRMTVFAAKVQIVSQPFLVKIVLVERDIPLCQQCIKTRQYIRRYI